MPYTQVNYGCLPKKNIFVNYFLILQKNKSFSKYEKRKSSDISIHDDKKKRDITHSSTEKVGLMNSSDSISNGKVSKSLISNLPLKGKKMLSMCSSSELFSNPK